MENKSFDFFAFTDRRINLLWQTIRDLYNMLFGLTVLLVVCALGIVGMLLRHWVEILIVWGLVAFSSQALGAQALPPGQSVRHEHMGQGRGEVGIQDVEGHIGVVAHVINPLDVNRESGSDGTVAWDSFLAWGIDPWTHDTVRVMWVFPTGL